VASMALLINRRFAMQIDHLQACAHAPCCCQVTAQEEYCSEHCREQAEAGKDECRCSHTECAMDAVPEPA
jgi:hypothetical protein